MSKKFKEESAIPREKVLSSVNVNYLEGRLLTIIDAVIPPPQSMITTENSTYVGFETRSQNKAVKDLVVNELWDLFQKLPEIK